MLFLSLFIFFIIIHDFINKLRNVIIVSLFINIWISIRWSHRRRLHLSVRLNWVVSRGIVEKFESAFTFISISKCLLWSLVITFCFYPFLYQRKHSLLIFWRTPFFHKNRLLLNILIVVLLCLKLQRILHIIVCIPCKRIVLFMFRGILVTYLLNWCFLTQLAGFIWLYNNGINDLKRGVNWPLSLIIASSHHSIL